MVSEVLGWRHSETSLNIIDTIIPPCISPYLHVRFMYTDIRSPPKTASSSMPPSIWPRFSPLEHLQLSPQASSAISLDYRIRFLSIDRFGRVSRILPAHAHARTKVQWAAGRRPTAGPISFDLRFNCDWGPAPGLLGEFDFVFFVVLLPFMSESLGATVPGSCQFVLERTQEQSCMSKSAGISSSLPMYFYYT